MKNNKNYFIQYGLDERKSIFFSRRLFYFRNMIKYLEVIIPKNITNTILDNIIVSLYYKYYIKAYKNENLTLFKMLSNKSIRPILQKIDLYIPNDKIKKLYDILLFYKENDSMVIDIDKEEFTFFKK